MRLLSILHFAFCILHYFHDGAAAQDQVTVVEHHGLPRGDGPLGLVKVWLDQEKEYNFK